MCNLIQELSQGTHNVRCISNTYFNSFVAAKTEKKIIFSS